MALYLVLEDFDGSESFSAAQTVDGNVYDLVLPQQRVIS